MSLLGDEKMKKGFTLAENLIVLAVLGIIMIIVIPGMVNDKNKRNNQIAVRKAVTAYQTMLNEEFLMATGVNNVNSLDNILTQNDCEKIRKHFNIRKVESNKCKFTTADGVKWDFATSDPQKTMISLKNETITSSKAEDDNNLKVFYLTYSISHRKISILTGADASKTRLFIVGE